MAILATEWIHSNVYSVNLRSITTHAVWLLHKYIAHIKGGINMFPRWTRIGDLYWQRIVKNDVTDNKEGGRTCVTYFAEEGYFFKTSACPRFVKERYFFVPRYEIMGGGWKSPYNPRNIGGSDAEWLQKWLGLLPVLLLLNRQRIIKYKVKIRVPVHPMSVSWIKEGAFFTRKSQRFFLEIRVLFWPKISTLGVFINFDKERMHPTKYQSVPPPGKSNCHLI